VAEILVVAELSDDGFSVIVGELLAAARSLDGRVSLALLGESGESASDNAIALGADVVYLVQEPLLADGSVDAQVSALEQVCDDISPSVVLIGKTLAGRDIGPRLAFRLGVGVAQDCVDLQIDPETNRVVATRPVYGGNALAKVTFANIDPQIVVLRPGAYDQIEADISRKGEVVRLPVVIDPSVIKVKHVETVLHQGEGVRMEDASIVISGGRGLGGKDPFKKLEELAEILGGAVGASRAACDAGWMDHGYQVGLTGKTIGPDLYITVGISGASQHMAGCSGARSIVAVNKDQDANIFTDATYGVVGDWQNVLPEFIETVRELVKS